MASSIIVSSIAGGAFGLYALHKKYGLLPDLQHASRTLLSSAVSAGASFGVVRFTSAGSPVLSLFLGPCVFLLAFLLIASFMRVIEENDIENLDMMLKGVAVIYPFARLLLEFERRIIRLTHKSEKK